MKMRKIGLSMLTGLMILCFTAPIQGQDYNGYRYKPSDSYKYRKEDYRKYSSHQGYYPHGSRYHYKYYYKSKRRILREIRKNERRILKLQRKIRKYSRQRHYRYYRYDNYTMRTRNLELEIRRLEHRNRNLRRLLYR